MKIKKLGLAFATVGICWSGLAAPAIAGNVYQGDDYSNTKNSNTELYACDKESDGRGVHADGTLLYTGGGIRTDDPDGAGGSCGYSGSVGKFYRHRTVEEITARPDAKSSWHYHA